MNVGRQFAAPVLALALMFQVSCSKQPPQLPKQATNPAETIPANLPAQISETTVPPPPPAPAPQPPPQEPPKQQPVKKRKRKTTQPATNAQSAAAATPPAASTSSGSSAATGSNTLAASHAPAPVVETPPDTAIAADVSNAELLQQKQTTAQLLDSTEKSLNALTRTLSHEEEETLSQVRSYIAQSRKATSEGDFERAYNLATKAHLLSDALVKK